MFQKDYRREMEDLGPGPGELERLYALVDGKERSAQMRGTRRVGRGAAAAIVACALLAATALAAGPGIWEAIQNKLGPFAPYAAPAAGTATDQGIEVALAGSISDRYTSRVYFTATDPAGRLNGSTRVSARLEGAMTGIAGGFGCQILSYDEAERQALIEVTADGLDTDAPVTLEVTGFDPGYRYLTGIHLQPPQEADTLQTAVTEAGAVVLLPGQTPQAYPECEGISLSSMGFDGDGIFHVRIAFEEGYSTDGGLLALPESKSQPNTALYQEDCVRTPVEGGIDYRFPHLTADRLEDVAYIGLYGFYRGPEEKIVGSWSLPVTLEQAEELDIPLDRRLGNFQVSRVKISPLTMAVFHTRAAGEPNFLSRAQIVLKDGGQAALGSGMASVLPEGENRCYFLWEFPEPLELEDIASIWLMGEEVWTNPN